jgi:NAD-dependent SIR2 family protein deacetylase
MYDTLQPELVTATEQERHLMTYDPTYVVSWDIFQYNPFPYLEVRKPFILGTHQQIWKATLAHRFFELLHTKTTIRNHYYHHHQNNRSSNSSNSKLQRIYTQNIDGLDYQCTNIPREKIVSVHGTIAEIQCEGCYTDMDSNDFCQQLQTNIKDIYHQTTDESSHKEGITTTKTASTTTRTNNDQNVTETKKKYKQEDGKIDQHPYDIVKDSKPILCPHCHQPLVKPKTVLFGRPLPDRFWECMEHDIQHVDLLIIAGTSLVVSPANRIVCQVPETTIRVIINHEPVGKELGIQYANNDNGGTNVNNNYSLCGRDLFLQGSCDEICLELIEHLQWLPDIQGTISKLPSASANLLSTKAYTSWF